MDQSDDKPAGKSIPAQLKPYPVDVEPGKSYAWCACGRSGSQPFCDGSHKGTGITPVIYRPEKAEIVYFCGCKATKSQPMCDGAHGTLPA